jgi:hypothetical protein
MNTQADTIKEIKEKYGENVIPLKKAVEPFMSADGYGYQGIILYDVIEDKIQCHLCGNWYKQITADHLFHKHGIENTREYKKMFGLYMSTPLESIGSRKLRSDKSKKTWITAPESRKAQCRKLGSTKGGMPKGRTKPAEFKNGKGICDAQLKDRALNLQSKLGREIKLRDDNALGCALRRRYGSFEEAKKILGLITKPTPKGWITSLVQYKNNFIKKLPQQ